VENIISGLGECQRIDSRMISSRYNPGFLSS
jgi:hypothetical protein